LLCSINSKFYTLFLASSNRQYFEIELHIDTQNRRGTRIANLELLGRHLAKRRGLVLLLVSAASVILRLSLLWLDPVPVPAAHDEFSYLLAADTFAHGKLANPTHPAWLFLDTIHVNQKPTYISKYPPAQGMVLALGQILGNPWAGVLLSVAAMCAAITWMLQGWLPPEWALLGGLLVVLRFSVFNYWVDSYWGGAVAASGGALVMGALPRLLRRPRMAFALLMGLGIAILAYSRPVEGLIFSLPVAAAFCVWLFRPEILRSTKLKQVLVPLTLILLAAFSWLGYYNWRGTGDPFLFPYVVYQKAHFSSPPLLLQSLPPERHFQNPQFTDYSNEQRAEYIEHRTRFLTSSLKRVWFLLTFVGGPLLAAPALTFPWLLKDRRTRLLFVQLLISLLGLVAVSAFFVHYAAPLTATIIALSIQGLRHLKHWQIGGRRFGVALTRTIVLICVALVPAHAAKTWHDARQRITWSKGSMSARAEISRDLESMAGKHLVIVHYSPKHDVHDEWVYNAAEIDQAKIVWARDIPGVDLRPLLDYFRQRKVWIVEPDSAHVELRPYQSP